MAIDVGKVLKDRMANLTPEQRAQFQKAMARGRGGKSWKAPEPDFDTARKRHFEDPRRCELLHKLYRSGGTRRGAGAPPRRHRRTAAGKAGLVVCGSPCMSSRTGS